MPRYMESLAEIHHRIETGSLKSRSTVDHGIAFRSRLEVRFAQHLDARGEQWAYEPRVYGPKGRRYLPDFVILGAVRATFIEVKPTIAQAIGARSKMAVIWEADSTALLVTAAQEGCTFSAALRGQPWETWQERWA